MAALEGLIHFVISQMRRLPLEKYREQVDPFFDLMRGYAPQERMTLMPQTVELLRDLSTQYRLAIVSTRERKTVETFLATAGLNNTLIGSVITGEDVRNLLPHSEALLDAASQLNLNIHNLLLVSDTDSNLRSGRAAEMVTVGVLSGLGKESDMGAADLILSTVGELEQWL